MSTTYSDVQKANCVLWLAETKDISTIQKNFLEIFPGYTPPAESEVRLWYEHFKTSGQYDQAPVNGEEKHVEFNLNSGPNLNASAVIHKDPSGVDLHATDFEKDTGLLNFFGFRKVHKCHPYKMHLKGKLDQETAAKRKAFAEVGANPLWPKIIYFSSLISYNKSRIICAWSVPLTIETLILDKRAF